MSRFYDFTKDELTHIVNNVDDVFLKAEAHIALHWKVHGTPQPTWKSPRRVSVNMRQMVNESQSE